ncbi:MAG: hypothetical protein DYG98_09050 [Haliscomenobacteraceae bacterium CHB4]|nr:hypothetical protein [Haliscomenobacteraceae bacterium CHB4]
MKNYLGQTLGLTFLVLLLLTGLSLVPENLTVGGFQFRKMDIFADVRSDEIHGLQEKGIPPSDTILFFPEDTAALALPDSMETDSFGPLPPKDSAFFGKIIEDYTFEQQGLNRFFAAVDSIKLGRKVRVAWYGDSFVEGDILIGDLRDTLQSVWGGGGVGYVPITSEVAQFKRTLKHQFRGWATYSIVKKTESRPLPGINGYVYRPVDADAKIHYEGSDYFRHTRSWTEFRLFYSNGQNTPFVWQQKDDLPKTDILKGKQGKVNQWTWDSNYPGTTAFACRFPFADSANNLLVYGASLENGPGIYFDNFSVRGNSGGPLRLLKPDFIRQFDALQHYDLVVLQVGLNAVTNSLTNIKWYEAELDRTFSHLRACFPNKPVLIVSVGDRAGKNGSELSTMRGVPAIVAMQRDLARKHGFLFYDMFWGMGGPGAIIEMAHHKPRYANTDYTHLTHEGGRVMGLMFATLFLEEQAKWKAGKTAGKTQ